MIEHVVIPINIRHWILYQQQKDRHSMNYIYIEVCDRTK